ncbi:hypothetical protein F4680DRAFT_437979 [Xylaria scruposa]|nr:hypothetical protein F4680DRAFT_437979 [Xylaria scruposa]
MHANVLGSLLAGAAVAVAQQIDFSLAGSPVLVDVPSTGSEIITFDIQSAVDKVSSSAQSGDNETDISDSLSSSSTVSSSKRSPVRRAACDPQPSGAGPTPNPDTPEAFSSNSYFSSAAKGAPVPHDYVQTFQNLNASNNANGYMGYTLLSSYDVAACAAQCNSIYGCESVNIYFERDPTVEPGDGCSNPPSTTNIKCVFWGGPVSKDNANNYGQWRDDFDVVIAGSNGYVNHTIAPAAGYGGPEFLGNVAIDAPLGCGHIDTHVDTSLFLGGPFDATLCATACDVKRKLAAAASPLLGLKTCNFFNTYLLNKNGLSVGQYCVLYSDAWGKQYATNAGGKNGSDTFSVSASYSFTFASYSPTTC